MAFCAPKTITRLSILSSVFLLAGLLAGCDKKPYVTEASVTAPPEAKLEKTIQSFNVDAQAVKFQPPAQREFNLNKRHGLGGWSHPAPQTSGEAKP